MELLTSNELRQKFSTPGNYSVTIFLILVVVVLRLINSPRQINS